MAKSVTIDRPQRWDNPFGPDMTDADVERVLSLEVFRQIDQTRFKAGQSLRDIIKNDARIARYQRGDVVFRIGDYGSSVFVVIEGKARVLFDDIKESKLAGRAGRERRSLFACLGQLWGNSKVPEVRDVATYQGDTSLGLRGRSTTAHTFFKDAESVIKAYKTVVREKGDTVGEIAALSRTPRSATVFAETDLEVVELRWQGLRDIRRRDRATREMIDGLYRERSLSMHLGESPLFSHLDEKTMEIVTARTLFETHGEFEWSRTFKKATAGDSSDVLKDEPVIVEEGSYLDGLVMIRSGFARITERLDHGERTVGFASKNDVFGLEEIVDHWREGAALSPRRSLRAIGYVDILRVPTALVEEHVLPTLPAHLLPAPASAGARRHDSVGGQGLEQSLVDFLVDNRTINGTATMLIDTDRCVGCDDCVRACASTHDNNPRFVRHGPSHGRIQVTNACMHCVDPVCLIGCPTGAINRDFADGRIMIDDRLCIGCGTCANSCPYNNIQLVEIRDRQGAIIVDTETKAPIVKATKCDLCYGQLGGPACERACPHDALVRIDMHDQEKLTTWINRS